MQRIYFDHNATTPTSAAVRLAMSQWEGAPLNPSSVHADGRRAKALVETARERVLSALGLYEDSAAIEQAVRVGTYHDYKVIFTSSCTEANNLVLQAARGCDLAISSIEHMSILKVAEQFWNLDKLSCEVEQKLYYVPVTGDGVVDLERAAALLAELALRQKIAAHMQPEGSEAVKSKLNKLNKPWLVSVMLVNNETGVLQPVRELAELVHSYGGLLHSDISQALGKMPVNLRELEADVVTFSPHKFGGPVGVGVLVFNHRSLTQAGFELRPLLWGGGQEYGLRSGTHNVLAIHGAGVACKNLSERLSCMQKQVGPLRDELAQELLATTPQSIIFGAQAKVIPNTLSLTMPNCKAELQVIRFDAHGVSLSAGAACSSGKVGRPYVHKAMGYSDNVAETALRISLGPENTFAEVQHFIELWRNFVNN